MLMAVVDITVLHTLPETPLMWLVSWVVWETDILYCQHQVQYALGAVTQHGRIVQCRLTSYYHQLVPAGTELSGMYE